MPVLHRFEELLTPMECGREGGAVRLPSHAACPVLAILGWIGGKVFRIGPVRTKKEPTGVSSGLSEHPLRFP